MALERRLRELAEGDAPGAASDSEAIGALDAWHRTSVCNRLRQQLADTLRSEGDPDRALAIERAIDERDEVRRRITERLPLPARLLDGVE